MQILLIDYEWLGTGTVRFGFVIGGVPVYAHAAHTANVGTSVYMSTPNNPLRYEISNSGAGAAATLEAICTSVVSEGGEEPTGKIMSVNNGITPVTGTPNGTTFALLGLRLRAANLGATISLVSASILGTTASDLLLWDIRLNPNVAGVFTYAGITNSSLERATGAAANTVTGGTVLRSGYVASNGTVPDVAIVNALRLGATIAGVVDTLVFSFTPVSGAPVSVVGALTFQELS